MKPNKTSIPKYFDLFTIKVTGLDSIDLPAKLWAFIHSIKDQRFDILDISSHYKSDIPQARKILDFLLSNKLCETAKSELISYQTWEDQNINLIVKPPTNEDNLIQIDPVPTKTEVVSISTDCPTLSSENDTNITVSNQSKNVYVEID